MKVEEQLAYGLAAIAKGKTHALVAYPGDEGTISRLQWPTVKINSKSSSRHFSGGFAAPASENTDNRAPGFSDLRVVTSNRHQAD